MSFRLVRNSVTLNDLERRNSPQVCVILPNSVNSRSRSLYVIARPSVVCRLYVAFVHYTQAIEIFGNVSTLFGTLAIPDLSIKILRRSSQGNPSVGG